MRFRQTQLTYDLINSPSGEKHRLISISGEVHCKKRTGADDLCFKFYSFKCYIWQLEETMNTQNESQRFTGQA